jgi:hypothetical protein
VRKIQQLKGEWRAAALLLFLSLAACNGGSHSGAGYHPMEVGLGEISGPECLNLQNYLTAVRTMNPGTRARYFTTDFQIIPYKDQHAPGRNFTLRAAYGSFKFEDTVIARITDLAPATQADCESVTLGRDGKKQVFKVLDRGPDYLTIENEWEERRTYRWLSPTRMKITIRFPYGDFLCSERTQSVIITGHELAWGEDPGVRSGSIDTTKIDSGYMAMILEATGITREELLEPAAGWPESESVELYDTGKLKQLMVAPVRPELLQCNGDFTPVIPPDEEEPAPPPVAPDESASRRAPEREPPRAAPRPADPPRRDPIRERERERERPPEAP